MSSPFTEEDHLRATDLKKFEAIDPLTHEEMFHGALYAMLSATDNYQNLYRAYQTLIHEDLDTPESVLARQDEVYGVLRHLHYGGSKLKLVRGLSQRWPKSPVPDRIIDDLANDHEEEFAIRKEIVADLPGFGPKCASLYLRMCGYENVVPVDLHLTRYLREQGYPVGEAKFDSYRGLSKKQHRTYEEYAVIEAEKHGLPPALFQMTVWAKRSNWIRPIWHPPPPRLPF